MPPGWTADGLAVDIARANGASVSLSVGWIINCTGPEEDLSRVGDPLTDDLFRSGAARPGAFGVGLDVDANARLLRADGTPSAACLCWAAPRAPASAR